MEERGVPRSRGRSLRRLYAEGTPRLRRGGVLCLMSVPVSVGPERVTGWCGDRVGRLFHARVMVRGLGRTNEGASRGFYPSGRLWGGLPGGGGHTPWGGGCGLGVGL